jgi:hypothetical protein
VKLEANSSKSNNVDPSSRGGGWNECKWGHDKSRLHDGLHQLLKTYKKTGTKPNKTPSLEKPSLAVIACLKMETTCALYKAIDNFYLYKAYKINKGRFLVFFVVHVMLAHR